MHFLLASSETLTFCSAASALLNKLLGGAGLQKSHRFILSVPAEPRLLKAAVALYRQNTVVISCLRRRTVSMTAERCYKGEFHCFCGIFMKLVIGSVGEDSQHLVFNWIKLCRMALTCCALGWVVLVLSLGLPVQSGKYKLVFTEVAEME